jgi:hypothetical protein
VTDALELPSTAQQLRDQGIPEAEVRESLESAQRAHLGAAEAHEVLRYVAEHEVPEDPVVLSQFSEIVAWKIREGLRGVPLAQAIELELKSLTALTEGDR